MLQLLLAAPSSGSGKTTAACALLSALKARGLEPCAFKCGPDYIDPMFHRAVLGVPSHNLDLFFSTPQTVRRLYTSGAAGHGSAVCEGAMGYYDGLGGVSAAASAWHTADVLDLPVLLVVRPKGASLTLAAQLQGLKAFRTPHHIAGVLLTDCTEMLYKLLALFDRPAPMAPAVQAAAPTVRIAVAQDEAFCFTYAETLESLQAAGAELCYFSPLRDAALPQHIGGLYLPGGYPELYAAQLAANTAMRCAINTAVQRGLPTVAECGGFLYLGQTLEDDAGTAHPMAGVLPGQGFRVGRLVRFGYAALTPQADSMLFRAGEPVPVHEFHHWDSTCNGTAFAAQKANGRHWDCGFANGHLYAGFPHLYWAGTPLPQRFVTAAAQYAQTKTGRTV